LSGANAVPDETMDLRGVPCPVNAARAIMQLALMSEGEVLEILIDDGEPFENVPASVEAANYRILLQEKEPAGHWRMRIAA
jgi:sulfite reductase (ferredoxin)